MKILAVGDVVGTPGMEFLHKRLRRVKQRVNADFVVVNGENASMSGMTPRQGDEIFDAGADVITLGNHVWGKRQIIPYLDDNFYVLRPANLAPQTPGEGAVVCTVGQTRILLINLIGRCDMAFGPDNPFLIADKLLKQYEYDLALCEFHANATSEKQAMGYYLDGRCAAVWGTHTHVQTADACIHASGTGYITDIGMTGPAYGVLGVDAAQSVAMFRGDLTEYFRPAQGACMMGGVVFTISEATGKCTAIEPFIEQEERI